MGNPLVWITGASRGIGLSLAKTVPWTGARLIGISRSRPQGLEIEHLEADLSDPASWATVGASFEKELTGFDGDRVVFVHAAGTLDPIGFAGEVDTSPYVRNVLLNGAAPLVLGHLFLDAVRQLPLRRHLIMVTSGAAQKVYSGLSAYGAGKAAIDQWVRYAGAEQSDRGGVQVLSVSPGTVDTGMQAKLRETSEDDLPVRQRFLDLHEAGRLTDPEDVARAIWSLLDQEIENGSVVDVREQAKNSAN